MSLYIGSDLIQIAIMCFIIFIVSSILSIFSPFGIGFAIFSAIRARTQSIGLRKVCLVFQIILPILTFIVGTLIALLFFLQSYYGYFSIDDLFLPLAIFLGVLFIFCVEIGIAIWENSWIKKSGINL